MRFGVKPFGLFRTVLVVPLSLFVVLPCFGEKIVREGPGHFVATEALRPRVEFWKLIFTEYGKDNLVFHHRDYPEVIYSVLDVGDYRDKYSAGRFEQIRSRITKEEISRIISALKKLSSGAGAKSVLERRIERLFAPLPGSAKAKYREALKPKQIRVQTGIRERFMEGLRRSGRYMPAIEAIFQSQGLPVDLAHMPLVESSFDYEARSSVGAAGIWQFVRSTGGQYLRINSYIDERRDPILASRAAAMYLTHAYGRLGEWPLAVTSYNHGISGILRGVKTSGSKRLDVIIRKYSSRTFGFASKNFYAEFLAALEVERARKRYFPDLEVERAWAFDEVQLGKSISFADLVRSSEASKADIQKLNPALLSGVISGRSHVPGGFLVKVPPAAGARLALRVKGSHMLSIEGATRFFVAGVKAKKAIQLSGTSYRVKRGDTLGEIARQFGVSIRMLMRINGINNPQRLYVGRKLKIPGRGGGGAVTSSEAKSYRVKTGDTIGDIAKRFSVSQRDLMKLNGISNANRLRAGAVLKIPGTRRTVVAQVRMYRVMPGDSFGKIARKLKTTTLHLKQLNPGVSDTIHPGQKLRVE